MENNEPQLNEHNKMEYPPMHTAEHLLNATMVKLFGCGRAVSAHVERKKSKLDYALPRPLTPEEVAEVERRVNEQILFDLPVVTEMVTRDEVPEEVSLSRLPDDASEMLRLVRVGDYDVCPCIGSHVQHTAEIGRLRISSANYKEGRQRLVFRLEGTSELYLN